ncbi:HAMP domain-containing sensor histidine kinase [uncultured Phocaeicola sp.]|jgi:signal transduction histidine kinase|uniref:sensor histidine kinase n=2 Tax=uncultured Phocaeicola sp. TaxID=990718 RepID=UPI00258300BD|nr:HAMP domain-containing sensor histidine kinase [uncultured Phocaeicola sp.]
MKRLFPFLIFLLCVFSLTAQNNQFNMDSTLFVYYQRCERISRTPGILQAADTLFRMAEKLGDKRTQAAALCHKASYFYFCGMDMDSLRYYSEEVKHFARQTGQPKYYYWIWGRYIEGYIIKKQFNLALLELKTMQEEATKENYMPGLISCYKSMRNVYSLKNNVQLAYEYQKKVVELIEQYDIEDFNLSLIYATLAHDMINLNKTEEAKPILEKAYVAVKRPSQEFSVMKSDAFYWWKKGNARQVEQLIRKAEALNLPDMGNDLCDIKTYYYWLTGEYSKIVELYESSYDKSRVDQLRFLKVKAEALQMVPGREKEANEQYSLYIQLRDSLERRDAQVSLEEFATIMDVSRLNKENSELELAMSRHKLHTTYVSLIGLGIFILVMCVFTFKLWRLNRRLRHSEFDLRRKNMALTEADKIIVKEKERAENASRMKSAFIQNMSHEIRTPLNSIVGFSQVLVEELRGQEDMKTYASVITENSNNLLKLVGDVLELSTLDTMDKEIKKIPVSINDLCSLALKRVKDDLKPEVELLFDSWKNEYPVCSDSKLIATVLDNLLLNAIKFTTRGKITLDCHLSMDAQHIEIVVTDTGIGIPEDKQEWVFERFTKVDEFTQGTGLGLAISRLAAQLLGGQIMIDSDYKEGCRMVFTLPADKV